MRAAPRARLGKISSGQPSLGPFQPTLGMSPGVPQFDPESFPTFLSMQIPHKSIPGQNRNFFARRAARAPGQNQFWPAQPRAIPAKSGYVTEGTQFDPEFQTHLSLRFSACRFHPNRFPVKAEIFLRAAPRARLGKISSGQPSLGPFQPNLGMSPGVPQFDPEFQSHLFLHF